MSVKAQALLHSIWTVLVAGGTVALMVDHKLSTVIGAGILSGLGGIWSGVGGVFTLSGSKSAAAGSALTEAVKGTPLAPVIDAVVDHLDNPPDSTSPVTAPSLAPFAGAGLGPEHGAPPAK
jgi:hypothetical protein